VAVPLDPLFPAADADVALWWLGQAGFALRSGSELLLVDPYLSDALAEKYRGTPFPHRRMAAAPVEARAISGITAVLCTHGHTDHMDPDAIPELQVSSDPIFVIPRSESAKGVGRGIRPERLIGLDAGEMLRLATGATITVVPAAHEELTRDESGQHLFLGYVLEVGGVRIYHSGDCVPYDGQAPLLADLRVDIALLPVNGRDAHRAGNGVPGNFHWHEAVDLCRAAGIPTLVCHHWGMFDFNTVDPRQLATDLEPVTDVRWIIPELGQRLPL
jgi:L-ascorbate metabolism protein UlaG (beta-lactamase superfamily)